MTSSWLPSSAYSPVVVDYPDGSTGLALYLGAERMAVRPLIADAAFLTARWVELCALAWRFAAEPRAATTEGR